MRTPIRRLCYRRRAFRRRSPLPLRRGRRPQEEALAEERGPEVGGEEGVEDGIEARVEVGEAVRHDLQHDERRAADVIQVELPQEQDHLRTIIGTDIQENMRARFRDSRPVRA